tara:strand:- start:71 stop:1216 length:1146 start_codon:yes stop_codon:yes gene_type:complete
MKKIFYWSPYLTNVATISAVINSIKSVKKYSKNYEPILINVCGEFDDFKKDLNSKNIKIINLTNFNYHKFLPQRGFWQSRLSYFIIFLISFFPLLFLIKSKKPDFFVLHLITSLPIIVSKFFDNNTKFILRISGLPRYNFVRKNLWKYFGKNLFKITCPTEGTLKDLIKLNLFETKKVILLRDPIIKIRSLTSLKNQNSDYQFSSENYNIFCVGRLTNQKNFKLIVNSFDDILKIKPTAKLFIVGEGEKRRELENIIRSKQLHEHIFLIGFKKNIFKYLKYANLFLLTSLWEDPGWVLIEAAACNISILSSNCKNGPQEFLENNKGGILFQNGSNDDLIKKFEYIINLNDNKILEKKIFSKKKSKLFTSFNHFLALDDLLK